MRGSRSSGRTRWWASQEGGLVRLRAEGKRVARNLFMSDELRGDVQYQSVKQPTACRDREDRMIENFTSTRDSTAMRKSSLLGRQKKIRISCVRFDPANGKIRKKSNPAAPCRNAPDRPTSWCWSTCQDPPAASAHSPPPPPPSHSCSQSPPRQLPRHPRRRRRSHAAQSSAQSHRPR